MRDRLAETRTCTRCHLEKKLSEFYPRGDRTGLRSHCKQCARKADQRWAQKNPEKAKAANRASTTAWRGRNPKRAKEILKRSIKKNKAERPLEMMVRTASYRAPRLGVPFEITEDDVFIPEVCPVLGIPLKMNDSTEPYGRPDDMPTLDRVNPSLGYVKGNVCVISMRANRLKQDASLSELEALVAYVKSHTPSDT